MTKGLLEGDQIGRAGQTLADGHKSCREIKFRAHVALRDDEETFDKARGRWWTVLII